MRHPGPIWTASATVVAVIVSVSVMRVLVLVAIAILLAGISWLIVARRTRLRVIAIP
jgi:hypothetical protein